MKSRNLTQSSLRNDPINLRMQGFSFRIFEDESGVHEVISSFSLDQSLNSSVQWKCKRVTNTGKQTARDLVEYRERIWRLIANGSSHREEQFLKERNGSWTVGWRDHRDGRSRCCVPLIESVSCDDRPILIVQSRLNRRSFASINLNRYNWWSDGADHFT